LATTLLSSVFPKTLAARDKQPYDFGFPKYGFSKEDLNNPLMEDPYDNAEKAADIIKVNPGLKDRALSCFGVELNDGDHGLQVDVVKNPEGDPALDVLPNTLEYINANCADGSSDWLRVRLFIFDSRTMDAYACYDGDDEICQQTGENGATSAPSPGAGGIPAAGGSATVTIGSVKALAQKLLDYKDQGKYSCDNPGDCQDLQNVVNGQPIGRQCGVDTFDPKILQLLIYLIDSGYKIGTFALCGDHHDDGPNGHHGGKAADISSINGKAINDPGSRSIALELDSVIFNLDNSLAPRQIITDGVGNVHDDAFTQFNRVAPGIEGAAATAAFNSGDPSTMAAHRNHIHVGF